MAPLKLKCHSAKQAPASHDPNTTLVNKQLVSFPAAANDSRLLLMCLQLVEFIIYLAVWCIKSKLIYFLIISFIPKQITRTSVKTCLN